MKQIIEVDSDDEVRDANVDKLGRILGFGRHKGCRVTVIVHGSPSRTEGAQGVHPIASTPSSGTQEDRK